MKAISRPIGKEQSSEIKIKNTPEKTGYNLEFLQKVDRAEEQIRSGKYRVVSKSL